MILQIISSRVQSRIQEYTEKQSKEVIGNLFMNDKS